MLRLVVPFAAGSTIDALARLIANKLPEVSKHKVVVVDNRPGAAGILGTTFVAKAKPDGRTVLIQANGLTTTPAVRSDLPYDLQKHLAPPMLVGLAPYGLVVPGDSKSHTLAEAFSAARVSGQPIAFGTSRRSQCCCSERIAAGKSCGRSIQKTRRAKMRSGRKIPKQSCSLLLWFWLLLFVAPR